MVMMVIMIVKWGQ